MKIYEESQLSVINGWMIVVSMVVACLFILFLSPQLLIPIVFLFLFLAKGFFIIEPNMAIVATFFGEYVGTCSETGFLWTNPLNTKEKISLKINNYNTPIIKVNDKSGNPIEIAVVVTWKIEDTAKAMFGVENYNSFLKTQSEAALRKITSLYCYDSEVETSLRKNIEEIAKALKEAIQKYTTICGVSILDARISHLAYSAEIAQAMLRKQQAEAVVMARKKIVEGAVSMVEEALTSLEEKELVAFTNDQKVQLITNLMTVLVSENETNQVVQLK